MSKLFVSYAHNDKEIVHPLVIELRGYDFDVWIDTQLRGGALWSPEIVKAITNCDFFLLFVSSSSTKSDNVRREVDLGYKKGRNFILLRLEKVDIPAEWDYQLAGIQWIEYEEPNWKERLLLAIGGPANVQHVENNLGISDVSNINTQEKEFRSNISNQDTHSVHYPEFSFIIQYLSDFENKIDQSTTNLNILIRGENEFNNLAILARKFESNLEAREKKLNGVSATNLARMAELAENIANQIHAAATSIASNGNPTIQLNQIKRNLPVLRNLAEELRHTPY